MEATVARPQRLGRYLLGAEIACGGMATVYLGRAALASGPGTAVAIKRLHPHLAKNPDFTGALADEARVLQVITHPNVVRMHEVVREGDEAFLVMDHILGEPLASLWQAQLRRGERIPLPITRALVASVLRGLGAAHRATDGASGAPLNLVHRDVSPQNILVARDGTAHLVDFGIARASGRLMATTEEGKVKGKLAYMAPEQVLEGDVTAQTDIYSAGVVLWELVTGRRLYEFEERSKVLFLVAYGAARSARDVCADVPSEIVAVLDHALARDPNERFATADEMADALEGSGPVATSAEVGAWAAALAGEEMATRARLVQAIEHARAETAVPLARATSHEVRGLEVPTATLELEARPRRRQLRWGMAAAALAIGLAMVPLSVARSSKRLAATSEPVTPAAPSVSSFAPEPPRVAASDMAPAASASPEATARVAAPATSGRAGQASSAKNKPARASPRNSPGTAKTASSTLYDRY